MEVKRPIRKQPASVSKAASLVCTRNTDLRLGSFSSFLVYFSGSNQAESVERIVSNVGKVTPEQPPFADRVLTVTSAIPYGHVTTYGHIARALGAPRSARMVGWVLNRSGDGVPAHRVVNRYGYLSGGWHFGHPSVMKARLVDEGVGFREDYEVNLDRHLWDPAGDRSLDELFLDPSIDA